MKIVIEHKNTKREIKGAFSICCDLKMLNQLKHIIDANIEKNFSYGWIYIDEYVEDENNDFQIIKRQKSLTNTSPIEW